MTTATTSPQNTLVHSYLFLRRAIGLIGIALPIVLIVGNILVDGGDLGGSLSGYYYSDMRDVLVGAMCAAGVFLIAYYGHNMIDNLASTFAGVGAIGLALFPTTPNNPTPWDKTAGTLHLVFAAVFFLMLAYICLQLFTRNDGEQQTSHKFQRNAVYRTCGVVIIACLVLIALSKWLGFATSMHLALWLECVAVWAFGLAWLVKGQTLLRN